MKTLFQRFRQARSLMTAKLGSRKQSPEMFAADAATLKTHEHKYSTYESILSS